MPEKSFTLPKLKELWERYNSIVGIRILKEGKWRYDFNVKNLRNIDGTRAESVKLSQVMSFITYLGKIHGK